MSRQDAADLGSVGLGACTAFGMMVAAVVGAAAAPLWLDDGFLSWSVGHRPGVALAPARRLTATGTGVIPCVLAVLAGLLAGPTARSRLISVALCLAVLGAGQAGRYGVMELVHRARPPHSGWATRASG